MAIATRGAKAGGSVWQVLDQFDARLQAGWYQANAQMIAAYARVGKDLNQEMANFADYVEQKRAAGETESPSWMFRDERYQALQRQIDEQITKFDGDAQKQIERDRVAAAELGIKAQSKLSQASYATFPPGFNPETWMRLETRGTKAMQAWLSQDTSPLRDLLQQMAPNAQAAAYTALTSGMALGWGPAKMATAMSKGVADMSLQRAQLISRTETMRAYRAAQREGNKANPVVKGWTWVAKLDSRTCAICWAMHGQQFGPDEVLPGHPNCRCAMVPLTKTWDELGLQGVPETRPDIPTGESAFANLSEADQLRILGPSRFKQFQNGQSLVDMVGIRNDPAWGPMATLKPVQATSNTPTISNIAPVPVAPVDPIKAMEDLFLNGPITNVQTLGGGISGTYTAEINGVKVVLKPETGNTRTVRQNIAAGREPDHEVAAYDFHKALKREMPGWDLDMPVVIMRDIPNGTFPGYNIGGKVAVMEFKPGEMAAKFGWNGPSPDPRDSHMLAIFDSVIGNTDRHAGNYLIKKDGRIVPIDHGLAFTTGPDRGNMRFTSSSVAITQAEEDALRRLLNDPDLRKSLEARFNQDEIDAFYDRVKWTVDHARTLSEQDLARGTPYTQTPQAREAAMIDRAKQGEGRSDVAFQVRGVEDIADINRKGEGKVFFGGDVEKLGAENWYHLDPADKAILRNLGFDAPRPGERFVIRNIILQDGAPHKLVLHEDPFAAARAAQAARQAAADAKRAAQAAALAKRAAAAKAAAGPAKNAANLPRDEQVRIRAEAINQPDRAKVAGAASWSQVEAAGGDIAFFRWDNYQPGITPWYNVPEGVGKELRGLGYARPEQGRSFMLVKITKGGKRFVVPARWA